VIWCLLGRLGEEHLSDLVLMSTASLLDGEQLCPHCSQSSVMAFLPVGKLFSDILIPVSMIEAVKR